MNTRSGLIRKGTGAIPAGGMQPVACGTVSFHDRDGRFLRTIGSGRMPESEKWALRRWLKNGFEPIGKACPDLAGIADGVRCAGPGLPPCDPASFQGSTTCGFKGEVASQMAPRPVPWAGWCRNGDRWFRPSGRW
ncbi:MAG: hypothetical protein OXC57_01680 [Rhodobacteraceae bacterium]|nr:hypothetical protein [Paracoccaceae bacterium]